MSKLDNKFIADLVQVIGLVNIFLRPEFVTNPYARVLVESYFDNFLREYGLEVNWTQVDKFLETQEQE